MLRSVLAGENAVKFFHTHSDVLTDAEILKDIALYATLRSALKQHSLLWLEDVVVAESSITVFFDLLQVGYRDVIRFVSELVNQSNRQPAGANSELITLPVSYGGEVGEDLNCVAEQCGVSVAEFIQLHQETVFTVTAVGFAPGFGYLKGLPPQLRLPRRSSPRTQVPKGALAIAEEYTAIYPEPTPAGWHLIGYCPETLFDVSLPVPTLFKVGQKVKFVAVG